MARILKYSGRKFPLVILFGCPIIFLVTLIEPIFRIKFAQIPTRFGPLCSGFDVWINHNRYLEKYEADLIIFAANKEKTNSAILKVIKRELVVIPDLLMTPIFIIINVFPSLERFRTGFAEFDAIETLNQHIIHSFASPISTRGLDHFEGRILQSDTTWNPKRPTVALCLRDELYNRKILRVNNNYAEHRDYEPQNCVAGIELMIESGYSVIRAGSVGKKIELASQSSFFDYPNSNLVSDDNDINSIALADFVIGVDTGLVELALLLRKPVNLFNISIFTNRLISPLYRLVQFNRFIDIKTRAEISLTELDRRGAFVTQDALQLNALGIRVQKTTPNDFKSFCQESVQFYEGKWVESRKAQELKEAFLLIAVNHGFRKDSSFFFPNYWASSSNWLK